MTVDVTVIIPCYNHSQYLANALDSVLLQTFSHWQVIVVDDGSTDNTPDIVAEFTDPRIQYLYQENSGLSAARNTGILAAKGAYLAFLDADDEWCPRFLENCLSVLKDKKEITGVVTLAQFIDEFGTKLPHIGGEIVRPEGFRSRLIEGGFFPPNAIVVKTIAVLNAGLFDRDLSSVEDWDLWLRITSQGGRLLSIAEPLAKYRVLTGSMSTNAGRMHLNRMTVLAKHFGLPQGDPSSWSLEKRLGYAFAYRTAAFGYIAQQETDQGWDYLFMAIEIEPNLLKRLDTFYELALGDQPRGYRGQTKLVDIGKNGADMLSRMENLFAKASPKVQAQKDKAYGNAHLALAMLSDQAGDWSAARHHLKKAFRWHPALLRDRAVIRRVIKLSLGQRIVNNLTSFVF